MEGRPTCVSPCCQAVLQRIVEVSPFVTGDGGFKQRTPHDRIEAVEKMILSGELLATANDVVGRT